MAKFRASQKPVRLALADGFGIMLARREISEFRRKNRQLSEGAYGPWENRECREQFVRISALIEKLENARQAIEGRYYNELKKRQASETRLIKARKTLICAEGKMRAAAENVAEGLSAIADALEGIDRERLALCSIGERYEKISQGNFLNGCGAENGRKYSAVQLGENAADIAEIAMSETHAKTRAIATCIVETIMRTSFIAERADGEIEGEVREYSRGMIAEGIEAFALVNEKAILEDPEVAEVKRRAIATIREKADVIRRGCESGQAETFGWLLQGWPISILDKLQAEIRQVNSERAAAMSETKAMFGQSVRAKNGKNFDKIGQLMSERECEVGTDIVMRTLREMLELDKEAAMAIARMLGHEEKYYGALLASTKAQKALGALPDEISKARAEMENAEKEDAASSQDFSAWKGRVSRFYGLEGKVGALQLAKAAVSRITYAAQEKKARAAANGQRRAWLLCCEEVAANSPAAKPQWKPKIRKKERKKNDEIKESEFFTLVMSSNAIEDIKCLDKAGKKDVFESCSRILKENSDSMRVRRDGIIAYKHTVKRHDAWRVIYIKDGDAAVIWRVFTDHDEYSSWCWSMTHKSIRGTFYYQRDGKKTSIIRTP